MWVLQIKTVELQDNNKVKGKDLFRLGGQKWRRMSSMEKMPYVKAAKLAQQQSQQTNKNGQQNKPDGSDPSKKNENQKDQKQDQKKKEREVLNIKFLSNFTFSKQHIKFFAIFLYILLIKFN